MRTIGLRSWGGLGLGLLLTGCATDDGALKREVADLHLEVQALKGELAALKRGGVVTEPRTLELPRAMGLPSPEPPGQTAVIDLARDGAIALNGRSLSLEDLKRTLAELAAKDPRTSLVVMADKELAYRRVVEILDLARAAGIARIALATQPAP